MNSQMTMINQNSDVENNSFENDVNYSLNFLLEN